MQIRARATLLAALILAALALLLPRQAISAETPAANPAASSPATAASQDVQAIVKQTEERLAAIQSYQCRITFTSFSPQGPSITEHENCFKRPDLYFCRTTEIQNTIPGVAGETRFSVADGKDYWQYMAPNPAGAKALAARPSKAPAAAFQKMIEEKQKPKLYHYDLARMKAANCAPGMWVAGFGRLLEPFGHMDKTRLRIAKEDAETWTLAGPSDRPSPELAEIQVAIGKKDGLIRTANYLDSSAKVTSVETISDAKINPALPDNQFTFKAPPGVALMDQTDMMLESFRRQGMIK